MSYDYLVVGAGLAGSVVAERLAAGGRSRVLVIDRRHHVAGNAYDELDESGIRVHRYGPHIFHTNSVAVIDYLSKFTRWRPYVHRVLARVGGALVPMPINRTTINRVFGLHLTSTADAEAFLNRVAIPVERPQTSEDQMKATVGLELYELLIRGYTRKMWGLDPSELNASVAARLPVRLDEDDRYFSDRFQAIPESGYTAMVEGMLSQRGIDVRLGTDARSVYDSVDYRGLVFTGPIDEYFDYQFGALPYRSIRFQLETVHEPVFQCVATVNEPDESVPYTRTTEFKHITGQQHDWTTIVREYPTAEGEPYYPIPRPATEALYRRYRLLANTLSRVWFTGRLGTYRYYNMDQVVAQGLAVARKIAASTRHDQG